MERVLIRTLQSQTPSHSRTAQAAIGAAGPADPAALVSALCARLAAQVRCAFGSGLCERPSLTTFGAASTWWITQGMSRLDRVRQAAHSALERALELLVPLCPEPFAEVPVLQTALQVYAAVGASSAHP